MSFVSGVVSLKTLSAATDVCQLSYQTWWHGIFKITKRKPGWKTYLTRNITNREIFEMVKGDLTMSTTAKQLKFLIIKYGKKYYKNKKKKSCILPIAFRIGNEVFTKIILCTDDATSTRNNFHNNHVQQQKISILLKEHRFS